jgi:cell division protein FtsL
MLLLLLLLVVFLCVVAVASVVYEHGRASVFAELTDLLLDREQRSPGTKLGASVRQHMPSVTWP